jgi:hypothetical protein
MSETYTSILIGGKLSCALLPQLTDLLLESALICDEIGNSLSVLPKEFNIKSSLNNDKVLFFDTAETDEGEFTKLEEWLQDNNLPYSRDSHDCINEKEGSTIPNRTVFWMPGYEEHRTIINDTESQHMIHVGEVEWILLSMKTVGSIEEAPKFINHGNVHEKAFAAYILQENNYDPVGYLNKHIKDYYTVPKLPAFEII